MRIIAQGILISFNYFKQYVSRYIIYTKEITLEIEHPLIKKFKNRAGATFSICNYFTDKILNLLYKVTGHALYIH